MTPVLNLKRNESDTSGTPLVRILVSTALLGFMVGTFLGNGRSIAGGCETYYGSTTGGPGYDYMVGFTGVNDTMRGWGGNDDIRGLGCHDDLQGNDGGDHVAGAYGVDLVEGNAGHDSPSSCSPSACGSVKGGGDADTLRGGGGNDEVEDNAAGGDADWLYGEAGNDTLLGNDADNLDHLFGGQDTDSCSSDFGDERTSCEN